MNVEDLPFLRTEEAAPAPTRELGELNRGGSAGAATDVAQVPPVIEANVRAALASFEWLDDDGRARTLAQIRAAEARVPGISDRVTTLLDSYDWLEPAERAYAQVEILSAASRSPRELGNAIRDTVWYADVWDEQSQSVSRRHLEELTFPEDIDGYAERPAAVSALRVASGMEAPGPARARGQDPVGAGQPAEPGDTRTAAQRAAAIDREQASHHGQRLPPVRGEVRAQVLAGDVPLPHHSSLNDPARITGSRHREMRQFRARVHECVACEYKKLETRLGDPATHGVNRDQLSPAQLRHFGTGEKNYTLCQSCHTANGKVNGELYARWAAHTMREDRQRTFRQDPKFEEIAARVAAVDRWRGGDRAHDLSNDLIDSSLDEGKLRGYVERDEEGYDGTVLDERVRTISELAPGTGKEAPTFTGGGRRPEFPWGSHMNIDDPGRLIVPPDMTRVRGFADPEYVRDYADYDLARHGKDEAHAYVMHEQWEARRKENFRRAWERTDDILDPRMRHQAQARLVERWDPKLSLADNGKVVETNVFAEPHPRVNPYSRGAWHSGVDEGFGDERGAARGALARHEANVTAFLREMKPKLLNQGYTPDEVRQMLTLPDLNPEREIGRFVAMGDFGQPACPLHERIQQAKGWVPHTAPAELLDQVVREAAEERRALAAAPVLDTSAARTDAGAVVALVERLQDRDRFSAAVREADADREKVQRWASAIRAADLSVAGATKTFANEIRLTFKDPQAFQAVFKELDNSQKRNVLAALRERPESFAHEFATACGKDIGRAGELASGTRATAAPVNEVERAGILTADAGFRYLDAVDAREGTRRHAAQHLGVPAESSLKDVRDACRSQMDAATRKKTHAIASRDSLGKLPTPDELGKAFSGLDHASRRHVMKQVPGITLMMENRQRSLSGPSL